MVTDSNNQCVQCFDSVTGCVRLRFGARGRGPGQLQRPTGRVSVQGVKSLGGHFACLCWGFEFYEVKKKFCYCFSQKNENTFTLVIIFTLKSL